ncbi:MAG: protein phosphatase 2C domain-containing protein [Roseovarius sp.]|jgi:serine/threonine protein phosphatase PrpC|nr:protein phosphatase 2C domain-containing protein [Roseovarius sp.]
MTSCKTPAFSFDTASAISQGARDYQEDALISDFSNGAELGFVVLSDGMGGHAAGDVASKIVVTEMFSELTFMRAEMVAPKTSICEVLRRAAQMANETLKAHVTQHPETKGMGATLVATVILDEKLHWISIGDSPLFLFRDNTLIQLNENHSLSRTIDTMVETGVLSAKDGANHPDRNVLTSVLFGEPIAEIDCPSEPTELRAGDTLIVASDGLQFLTNAEIKTLLQDRPFSRSSEIADALMNGVQSLNDPDLDNVSLTVIQVRHSKESVSGVSHMRQRSPQKPEKQSLFQKVFRSHPAEAETAGTARD